MIGGVVKVAYSNNSYNSLCCINVTCSARANLLQTIPPTKMLRPQKSLFPGLPGEKPVDQISCLFPD